MNPAHRFFLWLKGGYEGILLHAPVLGIVQILDHLFFKDPDLRPGARFVAGLFLVPLWYVLATMALYGATASWTWAAAGLTSLPLSLWLWSRVWHWVRLG